MSFFIDRISDTADETTTTRLPAIFDDRDAAIQALENVLAGYGQHGMREEYGYWWAWDDGKQQFKFVIATS